MTDDNLPVPDDMPWVIGLSQEEVQKLREDKQRLTEYARKKLKELNIPENDEIEDIMNIKLTEEEKEELDKMRLIDRFNEYLNQEWAAMPHGSFISVEHFEAVTLRATLYAFARKYNLKESIPVEELNNLADLIETQGNNYLERVEELKNE